ncbi:MULTISPECIES: hypothetical protein [Caproicibacter]|uniref:Uncharacterized protein n=1 Tax=Caproicibacter fermentans TaxID=2576756 RepID=A0A7G8T7R0_9FIRM|nr:hypothetical protein [Caproicibacter fermentans]QNK39651.1 hypothetical protein HCR03_13025 [Caproicibacter fermentans]
MHGQNACRYTTKRTKIRGIAFLAALVIPFFVSSCGPFQSRAEDPNWYKTHTTITSVDEAAKLFGGDLLLDKLVLKQENPKPYTEFILEYADENSKSINDRKTWRILSAQVLYGGERFDVEDDYINLTIFFQENDPSLVGSARYPDDGFEAQLRGSKAAKTIGGIAVKYREYKSRDFKYSFCSEFKYLGYTYFLESYSKQNPNLSWDTLNQMLCS